VHNQLTALLSQYPHIKLALLFGSQATGKARPDSDIDLGILAQEPLSAEFKLRLMQTIGADFGRPVASSAATIKNRIMSLN